MEMPSGIEDAMARVDRAAGAVLDQKNAGVSRIGMEEADELMRASLDLLNRIRRTNEFEIVGRLR